MSSTDPDIIFERLKRNPLLRLFYAIPGLDKAYHFLLSFFGAVRYGFPSRKIKVIGITGTKGKTTSTTIVSALLSAAGKKTALLSSERLQIGEDVQKNRKGNSMPGRFFIQDFLDKAVKAGCEYAVIEVTSQGVVMHRHRFIRWAVAAITNIHPEHIESHGSYENYRAAKLSFLKYAADQGALVFVNNDDDPSVYFGEHLPTTQTSFFSMQGLMELPEETRKVLPGKFNLQNVALALNILKHFGIEEEGILLGLKSFKGVPGRAEFVQYEPYAVVVDYAHTPGSLQAIYEAVQEVTRGKIIAVLGGAGGGRDRWKRPEMGAIAARYASEIILTNEDPWDEDPDAILDETASGFPEGTKYERIMDRKEAIRAAMNKAEPGDSVVITGKGSELYMRLAKGEVIEWSDRGVVEEVLSGG
jgi:UDP-N-acetylmuramoyl-L-alanyl-D-glutamate--2,6-diaminopimelate ligase